MSYIFHHAAVAGTFDRLHKGHQALLTKAFQTAEKVSIGITTPQMLLDKQFVNLIQTYDDRQKMLQAFIEKNNWQNQVSFFPLNDMYGPALTDMTLDALVVSSQTEAGAKEVNQKRKEKGLSPLAIVVAEYIESDDASYLSSTRIRGGEINREGFVYKNFLLKKTPYKITLEQRTILSKPIGQLLSGKEDDLTRAISTLTSLVPNDTLLFSVGDIVTQSIQVAGISIALSVIDEKNKREVMPTVALGKRVVNEAGTISKEVVEALFTLQTHWLNGKTNLQLIIDGEEDLLVLPILLLAPLQSIVVYGQSGEGIVMITVTEEKKQEIINLLS